MVNILAIEYIRHTLIEPHTRIQGAHKSTISQDITSLQYILPTTTALRNTQATLQVRQSAIFLD
jgi:hypothetical protein